MKKIIKGVLLLLVSISIINCTEDDNDSSSEDFSSLTFWTSDGGPGDRFDATEKVINVDDYLSFQDLSRGLVSHEWTVTEGTRFLNNNFTELDSVYTRFIIPGLGTTTDEALIHVLFEEPGIHEIKLSNTYKDSVAESVFLDGVWAVEKIFTVEAFAHPNPELKIFNGGVEELVVTKSDMPRIEDKDSWPTLSIEAGTTLQFVDLTVEGRPTQRQWIVNGGKPETSNDSIADITYNKLGDFYASIASERRGGTFPTDSVHKLIPLKINVIPSTKPFTIIGEAEMDVNSVIRFSVTGEMEGIASEEGNFTVNVVNSAANFDQDIAVASAVVSSTDGTVIELTLDQPVFNTDVITISYTDGNVTSVDARNLVNFNDIPVTIDIGSSVLVEDWASFENANGNWKAAFAAGFWAFGNQNGSADDPFYARTEDRAFAGVASMRYNSPDGVTNKGLQGSAFAVPNTVLAGTYRVSYMVYLELGNTMKAFNTIVTGPNDLTTVWDIENLPRGEWVKVETDITIGVDAAARFDLRMDPSVNAGVTGEQTIYFDDLKWIRLFDRE